MKNINKPILNILTISKFILLFLLIAGCTKNSDSEKTLSDSLANYLKNEEYKPIYNFDEQGGKNNLGFSVTANNNENDIDSIKVEYPGDILERNGSSAKITLSIKLECCTYIIDMKDGSEFKFINYQPYSSYWLSFLIKRENTDSLRVEISLKSQDNVTQVIETNPKLALIIKTNSSGQDSVSLVKNDVNDPLEIAIPKPIRLPNKVIKIFIPIEKLLKQGDFDVDLGKFNGVCFGLGYFKDKKEHTRYRETFYLDDVAFEKYANTMVFY